MERDKMTGIIREKMEGEGDSGKYRETKEKKRGRKMERKGNTDRRGGESEGDMNGRDN